MSMPASFQGTSSLLGHGSEGAPYRLAVRPFPPGHFRVHAFRARERLSKPYVFDITVTTSALVGEDLERLALGQRAAFVMTLDGLTRTVPGIIAAVRSEGVRPAFDAAQYRMRLRPALWRLCKRKGSRIFQDVRVDDVVATVLREAGIATRAELTRKYPARAYCTQYEETDLAFVERPLAEAGIFYYFAPPVADQESLVESLLGATSGTLADVLGPPRAPPRSFCLKSPWSSRTTLPATHRCRRAVRSEPSRPSQRPRAHRQAWPSARFPSPCGQPRSTIWASTVSLSAAPTRSRRSWPSAAYGQTSPSTGTSTRNVQPCRWCFATEIERRALTASWPRRPRACSARRTCRSISTATMGRRSRPALAQSGQTRVGSAATQRGRKRSTSI